MTKLLAVLLASTVVLSPFYLSRLTLFGLPIYLPEIPIILATLIWACSVVTKSTVIYLPPKPVIVSSFLFLAGAIISTLLTGPDAYGSLKSWVVAPMIFSYLTLQILRDRKSWYYLEIGLLGAVTLVSLIGLAEFFQHPGLRVDGLFNSPNALAMWLAPMIFLTEYLSRTKTLITRAVQLLGIVALVLTGSYGGIIAFATALLVLIGLNRVTRETGRTISTAFLALFLLLVAVSLTPLLDNVISPVFGHSAGARYQIWEVARVAIERNPIFGIGPGMFENFYLGAAGLVLDTPIEWAVPQPHNFYLATYLSVGIIGSVGLLGVIWLVLKNSVEQKYWPLVAALLVILIHGLIDTTYWKNDLSLIFWLSVALSVSVFKTSSSSADKASQLPV